MYFKYFTYFMLCFDVCYLFMHLCLTCRIRLKLHLMDGKTSKTVKYHKYYMHDMRDMRYISDISHEW